MKENNNNKKNLNGYSKLRGNLASYKNDMKNIINYLRTPNYSYQVMKWLSVLLKWNIFF